MTLEQFKENDRLGIITDERSIEALLSQFGQLPVNQIFHPEVRNERAEGTSLISSLLESTQMSVQYAEIYDYSKMSQDVYKLIRDGSYPESYSHSGYDEAADALDSLVFLAARFAPRYRKRKGV